MTKVEFKNIFDKNFDEVRAAIFYRCGDEELATDITQECFLKLWEKKDKINTNRAVGLLFKMAIDLYINTYHHKKRTEKVFQNLTYDTSDFSPEELMNFEQLQNKYEQLVEAMPENQKIVFLMSRIDGLMYKEIAERLGLSVKAVEKRMKIALDYLKSSLLTAD